MLSDASDVLALEDELRACEKRRRDFISALNFVNEYHLNERYPDITSYLLGEAEMASCRYHTLVVSAANLTRPKRGRFYGERDKALHETRAQVVAEMRRRKRTTGLSWSQIVTLLRANSAYAARLRGKTDATWIRYAKSGFSG